METIVQRMNSPAWFRLMSRWSKSVIDRSDGIRMRKEISDKTPKIFPLPTSYFLLPTSTP
jgi:hypothetical protein